MRLKLAIGLAATVLAAPALAEDIKISMASSTYAPAQITAAVGDTLHFVNDDETAHNVFIPTAAFATDLGKQDPAAEAMLPLRAAGSFEVECVFHPDMLITVEVTQ